MPIYEYECLECGIHFDKLQRFGDPRPDACPKGHRRLQRLFSQPAIIFKGSGFYVTDHGRNSRGKSARNGRRDRESESTSSHKAKEETTA